MERFARECWDELDDQLDGASRKPIRPTRKKVWELTIDDQEGLELAATRVLQEVQRELRERKGGIDHFAGYELYVTQMWCLNALLYLHGTSFKFAKEMQIKVANGRPLTICVGTVQPKPVTTILRTHYVAGGGCYRVFEDSLRLSAHPFARWCPDCRGRKTSAIRTLERELRRRDAKRHAELSMLRASQTQNSH